VSNQRAWKKFKRSVTDADADAKNEKGIKEETRYCSLFFQDAG
jgi:hypothetical protein